MLAGWLQHAAWERSDGSKVFTARLFLLAHALVQVEYHVTYAMLKYCCPQGMQWNGTVNGGLYIARK